MTARKGSAELRMQSGLGTVTDGDGRFEGAYSITRGSTKEEATSGATDRSGARGLLHDGPVEHPQPAGSPHRAATIQSTSHWRMRTPSALMTLARDALTE
jgi:hypothetical protein